MSLIPSESYSFPDHFTQTITYKNDPKRKKSEAVAQLEPRKKGFFLPLRKSLGRKKTALPSTAIPEESDAEIFPPLAAPENGFHVPVAPSQVWQPKESLPVAARPQAPCVTPEVGTEKSIPAPIMEPELPPQKRLVPIARPASVIRKSPVPPSLKPKPRWNMRAAAPTPPAPTSDNGGPHVGSANIPEQKITPTKPAQPAPPPRVVQSPSLNPIQVPPARVVESPPPDLMQVLFAHAGQAPAPPPESAMPAPRPDARPTLRREMANGARPRPVAPAPVSVNHEFDFEVPFSDTEPYAQKRRRSSKFTRFIFCESLTLAVFLPLAILGFCRVFSDPVLVLLINILTIAAAVTAAVIPILFFALAPTLPRDESMNSL